MGAPSRAVVNEARTTHQLDPSDDQSSRTVRVPVQARSRRTVERILAAATEFVAREGLGPFTTAAVAREAGVNIATLYSYFPDKMAILRELVRRHEEARMAEMRRNMAEATADNWREWVEISMVRTAASRVEHTGGTALRRAIRGTPELREMDDEGTLALADELAARLQAIWPRLSIDEAERLARTVLIYTSEVMDHACSDGTFDEVMVGEATRMVTLYMASYLEPSVPAVAS